MPNWVYNSISIDGKTEDLKLFLEKATKPRLWGEDNEVKLGEPQFSFWNFIAPPQEAIDSGEYFAENGFDSNGSYGDTENNWYNWNIANWGTKWDSRETEIEDIELGNNDWSNVVIRFQTAWGQPEEVFRAMVEQHPNLYFSFDYEGEEGWGGEYESENNKLSVIRQWNIPESHADIMNIGRTDCRCEYGADEKYWYADCPRKEKGETND
jgi:Ferredoxin-like domain in Api92-like protein